LLNRIYEQKIDDECDGIISKVYRSSGDITTQKKELIVRAPQILATFNGNYRKISK
jgi:hypothetical protein